jgi:hypothetical protein
LHSPTGYEIPHGRIRAYHARPFHSYSRSSSSAPGSDRPRLRRATDDGELVAERDGRNERCKRYLELVSYVLSIRTVGQATPIGPQTPGHHGAVTCPPDWPQRLPRPLKRWSRPEPIPAGKSPCKSASRWVRETPAGHGFILPSALILHVPIFVILTPVLPERRRTVNLTNRAGRFPPMPTQFGNLKSGCAGNRRSQTICQPSAPPISRRICPTWLA